MHRYLQDTEFASQNLFRLATDEENHLKSLVAELPPLEEQLKVHQWDFETSDLSDDFSDAYVMAAFGRAARSGQEVQRLKGQVAELQASVGVRQHSVQAIAGAILQIAKQGISVVYGALGRAPAGRMLGSLALRDTIWQARNQSMHYEEGLFKKEVVNLFSTLEAEQGHQFSLTAHAKQNRAKQVIDALGWKNYDAYLRDMRALLP
jgi:hypothetical protein